MPEETKVDAVLERLNAAIGALETAVDGRLENDATRKDAETQVQRMSSDRSRLAEALDEAEARCQRLENVNREVSARLVNAMENIRSVLENSDGS